MRIEKEPNQINYWTVIDDSLAQPINIGIEHKDGELQGLRMTNPAAGKTIVLSAIELEAVAMVFNESGYLIHRDEPSGSSVV